jgi:radical SAM protein (TIGR01212 family)
MKLYYPYSEYLKNKYGEKVYKLPLNLPGTCPNRDGRLGTGGCDYCGDVGAGFESLSSELSVPQQLEQNQTYIGKKYNAKKFIPYFQNYTGTYLAPAKLESFVRSAVLPDMVGINISTRPDCVSTETCAVLAKIAQSESIDITLELGLQTANYHTLKSIHRGHGLAEFIDAVLSIKKAGLSVSAHVMLDLPSDILDDAIETARVLSALAVDGVKLHSLYVANGSAYEAAYQEGQLALHSEAEYIARAVAFLANLSPDIYVERLIGRVPEAHSAAANFGVSWWKVKDDILKALKDQGLYQGANYNYLNGSALI